VIKMSEKKFEFPKLPELPLPPKGFGLLTGQAGERRGGNPRTEAERRARHPFSSNPGTPSIEEFLPAEFPAPPIPRFIWRSMKKE